jgi:hypothetical protein
LGESARAERRIHGRWSMQVITLRRPTTLVKPTDVYSFVDVIRVWLQNPLPRTQMEWLGRHCGGGAKLFFPPFKTPYRCILQLHQPSDEALAYLARLDGIRLTYAEIANDLDVGRSANS